MNYLHIYRFNGTERFAIGTARCFTVGTGDELTLWFEIETVSDGSQTCSDTAEYAATPSAELGILVDDFNLNTIAGREFHHAGTADDEEDSCTSLFYYYEHQPLRENHVTVISRIDDRTLRIRWTARTQDVCYYDGSKPDAIIEIESNFEIGPIIGK
jgi:hypothetical protein